MPRNKCCAKLSGCRAMARWSRKMRLGGKEMGELRSGELPAVKMGW